MKFNVLDVDLLLQNNDLHVFIPIVGTLLSFVIFWFLWQSEKLKNKLIRENGHDLGWAKLVIFTKILGGLIMGLLPAIIYLIVFPETLLTDFGWGFPKEKMLETFSWTVSLGILMLLVVWKNAKKPDNHKSYPQIRAKSWTKEMVAWNLVGWVIYLIGYEALFRGVLLFPLVKYIGLWPAIAVNIGLYAGTHIPKGLKETLGSIPLCIVLCILSVQVGNIWIAAIVHVVMAWTNELVSLKHHPGMTLKFDKQ